MSARSLKKALGAVIADRSISDEMHRVERHDIDVDRLAEAGLDQKRLSFDEWVANSQAELARELVAQGHPPPYDSVLSNGVDWRPIPEELRTDRSARWADHVRPGETSTIGWHHIQNARATFSHPWFAARLAQRFQEYERADANRRPYVAYLIGHTIAVWESRVHHNTVKRGTKVRNAASDGGKARSADHAETREKILNEMQTRITAGHSVSRAAALVRKAGLGVSAEANRKMWARWRC